jgi:hypothetical protein
MKEGTSREPPPPLPPTALPPAVLPAAAVPALPAAAPPTSGALRPLSALGSCGPRVWAQDSTRKHGECVDVYWRGGGGADTT